MMTQPPQETFNYAWKTYKNILFTSEKNKLKIERWQHSILYLTIIAAVVGGLGGYFQKVQLPTQLPILGSSLFKLAEFIKHLLFKLHLIKDNHGLLLKTGEYLGYFASIILLTVTYFSSKVLTNDKNQSWQNLLSIAEAIKSKCFLFATSKAEYKDISTKEKSLLLLNQTQELYGNISPNEIVLDYEDTIEYLEVPMNVATYKIQRLDWQYNKYSQEIKDLLVKVNRYENTTLILGFFTAILSFIATKLDVAVLITLFSAITSTFSSFITMKRSRETLLRYATTKKQLDILKLKYNADLLDENTFVVEVERLINNENSAWMNNISTDNV